MPEDLSELPLEDLIEARDAYREGRVRLVAAPELQAPEVREWLADCNRIIAAAIEAEIARRQSWPPKPL